MRSFLCWIAVLALLGTGLIASAATGCAGTRTAAIRLAVAGSLVSPRPETGGYRVTAIRWDPVLRQNWATIVTCGHPEWPGVSLRVAEANTASRGSSVQVQDRQTAAVPMVRAGDVVQLWRQEDLLRIEVGGVAEQSGGLGETIQVRLLRRNGSNQSTEEQFSGVVRGRADVEMLP